MFINVTRPGADRCLRLAITAICYLDQHPDGAIVRLASGDNLLVIETCEEIEQRIADLPPTISAVQSGDLRVEYTTKASAPADIGGVSSQPEVAPGVTIKAEAIIVEAAEITIAEPSPAPAPIPAVNAPSNKKRNGRR